MDNNIINEKRIKERKESKKARKDKYIPGEKIEFVKKQN